MYQKKNMARKIPVIEISGSPYEMGYQHGSKYRDQILNLVEKAFKWFEDYAKENNVNLSKERVLTFSNKSLPYAEEYAPDLLKEIHGIAEGAKVSFEELFCFNCWLDNIDFIDPKIAANLLPVNIRSSGCTTCAVSGKATSNKEIFVAQNFDLYPFFQDGMVLLKVKSKTKAKPDLLIFTIAGQIGFAGQNNAGISLVMNKLFCTDIKPGVPYTFIARKILESKRIGDAIETIISAKRLSGNNYVLSDANGELYDIETTATDYEVIYGLKGYIGRSNHYLIERLKLYERKPIPGDYVVRWGRINKLLVESYGQLTLETLQRFLKDHVNCPRSICRHYSSSEEPGKTISSIILEPKERRAWYTNGNPCENEYVEYKL